MDELTALDGVPLTHRRVKLSEVELHVVEAGAGEKLVVLLHGFPEFWFTWRAQIPALARAGYRVVAPDMRGYNTSDKPKGVASYDVVNLSRDVAELIQAMGAERADVVGHDWGGAVAWMFAMFHGDRLRRLVIMNAPHPAQFQKALRRDLGQLRRSWYMFFFQVPAIPERLIRMGDFTALRNAYRGLLERKRLSEEDLGRYKAALAQPGALTSMLNYYRAAMRRLLKTNPPFQPITAPVQVIWGQRDHFIKPELADAKSKWCEDVRVHRVADANHFVQEDAPDEVNAKLLEFLG
ncbi:MAG TPA: alpha/beta hydrolase [Myxococcaceae bacterium]|nr:alpha/beta hydrolase [Myxococcaceae bacterium]